MIVSTWTEDRAMLGSNPSAVPGAATEGPGHRPGVPPDSGALRDQHQCDKPIVQPPKRLRIVQPAPSRLRRTSTNPWSAAFLSLILFADRENDQRLKLWSAQALSQHPDTHARELGVAALWNLVQFKESHSWTHAARWLVEHGPAQAADKAREALISEAGTLDSDRRME